MYIKPYNSMDCSMGSLISCAVLANRKFTRIVTYTVKYWFSAWPDRRLKCCHILDSLAPIWYWLEIFKKVRHVFLPQGTWKLQAVKVESLKKSLQPGPEPTQKKAQIQDRPGSNHSQSLMAGNFAALWPTDPKFSAIKILNPFKMMLSS